MLRISKISSIVNVQKHFPLIREIVLSMKSTVTESFSTHLQYILWFILNIFFAFNIKNHDKNVQNCGFFFYFMSVRKRNL